MSLYRDAGGQGKRTKVFRSVEQGGIPAEEEYARRRLPRPPVERGPDMLNAAQTVAFEQYYNANKTLFEGIAAQRGTSSPPDTAQLAFMRSLKRFTDPEPVPRAYGLQIVDNLITDEGLHDEMARGKGHVGSLERFISERGDNALPTTLPGQPSQQETRVLNAERFASVSRRLSERDRMAIHLEERGLSLEEIGLALGGKSADAAKVAIYRARNRFAKIWLSEE